MKKCLLFSITALFVMCHMVAQQNVTDTYLTNAGFNSTLNYLSDYDETVASTNPGTMGEISGWTASPLIDWSIAGTYEYGWSGPFNDADVPTSGADGTTEAGQGALAFSVGWGNSISYSQNVTLPAGNYTLEYAMCFAEGGEIQSNLTGWVPNYGISMLSKVTSIKTQGEWGIYTVDFKIYSETSGKIRVGVKSLSGSTSTAQARVFFDYVKLTYYSDLDLIIIDLEKQKALAETNASILTPGVYNIAELESAIANADSIDYENTNEAEVQAAITMLETANANAAAIMEVYNPLKEAIEDANYYLENTYYAGREELKLAIADAMTVYKNPTDQSAIIDETVNTLNDALTLYKNSCIDDVTSSYISNPGFDINCNYSASGKQTVGTTNPGTIKTIIGWTKGEIPSWSAAATFEFGWGGTFNGISAPSKGADGATGSGNGGVGMTVGWSGSIEYSQKVTLPAGKYSIEYAVMFMGASTINNNLIGWIPEEGESVLSNINSATTGEWQINSVSFTLSEATTGSIQVGMQANQSSSTANARVFVDYVKLVKYLGDKTDLEILSDSATVLYANQENVSDGSTVYSVLDSVNTAAQVILNDSEAINEDILFAENALKVAIDNVHTAILAYNSVGASMITPLDFTYKIINPDFELNGGSTEGWVTDFGIYNGANAIFDGAPAPNQILDGDPDNGASSYQIVKRLPEGVYRVKAVARGRIESSASMYVGAEAGSSLSANSSYCVGTLVNRIGDTGGDLGYGFSEYESPLMVLMNGENKMSLGIYFVGDCGWSSVDNFELYYCGTADSVINYQKEILTQLKDSTNMPSNYDLTSVDALINTDITENNLFDLVRSLEKTINTLRIAISENVDATLADIKVDGETIEGFSPTTYEYTYNIHTKTTDMPEIPEVTVDANGLYSETPIVKNTDTIPGVTKITVTAGNGDTLVYTININSVVITSYDNYTATYDSLQNVYYELGGIGQLTITGNNDPLKGSLIDLVSTDTWIYFPNLKPSEIVSSHLENIRVNGNEAVHGTNVWVAQYLNGAMVIPHSASYDALTVYSDKSLKGSSMNLHINTYYKSSALGNMNDNIESFVLKKGYMATFASNQDGTGISRVFIADKNDITINAMPSGLSNTVSLVVVRRWRWVCKKAWRGSLSEAERFKTTSRYDYDNYSQSTLDVEYVPMRHNPNWNAYSNFLNKYNSTSALGYNEPDNSVDDGYSTVANAITAWPNMMQSGLRLGSPAVTDGGLSWLYDFIDKCDALNYRVDFVAWHFYRRGYSAEGLYNALKAVHERTGRPLWITEWNNGCNWTYSDSNPVPSIKNNGKIIDAFTAMMDTCSFVERYFVWNGCNENLRMTNSSTGELYPAGIAYRDQISTMAYTEDYYNSDNINGEIIQERSEGFCSVDGSIQNDRDGYTGSGYLNVDDAAGKGIDWKVVFSNDGKQTMTFRYATTVDCYANLFINNEKVADSLLFAATPSLSQWADLPVAFFATAGIDSIRLEAANDAGLPNIDYLQITGITAADCDASVHTLTFTVKGDTLIQGATISFNSSTYTTDTNGVVTIKYVNHGEYDFNVIADGYETFSGTVVVDDVDVNKEVNLAISSLQSIIDKEISIYPNPAEKSVTVEGNSNISDINIYDNCGRLVIKQLSQHLNKVEIPLDNLDAGVYFLRFSIDNKLYTEKLIVK